MYGESSVDGGEFRLLLVPDDLRVGVCLAYHGVLIHDFDDNYDDLRSICAKSR